MTLETFFGKFDLFAEAAEAVARMRELVLKLAIQGHLVPHLATEPPVPYISIEDGEPINGSAVPANWRVVLLSDAIKNRSGNSKLIKGKLHEAPAPNLHQAFSASGADVWCDEYEHEGDAIIISAVGARCGKAFKASGKWSAIANTNIARPEPAIFDFDFAYLILNDEHFWVRSGSAQPFVKFPPSLDRHFAVPPLAEQKRIVAKVDELLAMCDRLEAQQQERETQHASLIRASLARFAETPAADNLQLLFGQSYTIPPADLRKSILTLAVQGKLVLQDPNDPSASDILASGASLPIGHVRRRKIMKRAPITSPDDMFPDLPASWEYADVQRLYDLNLIVDYADGNHGSLYPRSREFGDSGVTFVTARDIAGGRVLWSRCALLNEDKARQLTKGWARGGDVLLTHNATVGRVARVEREVGEFLLGTSVTFYRLNEEFIDPSYFYYVLCSPTWQGQLEAIMEQTTRNQVSIQKQAFFRVPIPPLAEQRRIVARVDQLMALVDAMEIQVTTSRKMGASLVEAMVTELKNAA
jgi:type I restriction enzyme S subunit